MKQKLFIFLFFQLCSSLVTYSQSNVLKRYFEGKQVVKTVITADGKSAISSLYSGARSSIVLWRLETGNIIKEYDIEDRFQVSYDSKYFLTTNNGNSSINIYDIQNGNLIKTANLDNLNMYWKEDGIIFNPKNSSELYLASQNSSDNSVSICKYNYRTNHNDIVISDNLGTGKENITISMNGQYLIAHNVPSGKTTLWNTDNFQKIADLPKNYYTFSFFKNSSFLFAGLEGYGFHGEPSAYMINCRNGEVSKSFIYKSGAQNAGFANINTFQNNRFLLCGFNSKILIWDVELSKISKVVDTNYEGASFPGNGHIILLPNEKSYLRFNPNGRGLEICALNLNTQSEKELMTIEAQTILDWARIAKKFPDKKTTADKKAFELVGNCSVKCINQYLDNFPNGAYRSQVKDRLRKAYECEIVNTRTPTNVSNSKNCIIKELSTKYNGDPDIGEYWKTVKYEINIGDKIVESEIKYGRMNRVNGLYTVGSEQDEYYYYSNKSFRKFDDAFESMYQSKGCSTYNLKK